MCIWVCPAVCSVVNEQSWEKQGWSSTGLLHAGQMYPPPHLYQCNIGRFCTFSCLLLSNWNLSEALSPKSQKAGQGEQSQPATLTQPPSLRPEDSQLPSQWCIIRFYTCLRADLHVPVPIFLAWVCTGWSETSRPLTLSITQVSHSKVKLVRRS